METLSALALIVFGMLVSTQANYCSNSYCSNGVTNVGCNPPAPPTYGPSCQGKAAKDVPLSASAIDYIVAQHNDRRQQLASGELPGFESAIRMPTLVWDTELANQAQSNARSCVYAHDRCRNTKDFRYAGQNIAIIKYYGYTYTVNQLIDVFVSAWWNEYKDAKQSYMDAYPAGYSGPAIGHFTQMASDRAWKIGCAMMSWTERIQNFPVTTNYFVCDYSITNIIDQPVYERGSSAQNCVKRPIEPYPALCAIGEPVNSNL